MKRLSIKSAAPLCLCSATLAVALALWFQGRAIGGEDTARKVPPPAKNSSRRAKPALTGPELYALHCNRCHPERYAPERTAEQWKTILLHMRTRANLPAQQARLILKYLQEDSGK